MREHFHRVPSFCFAKRFNETASPGDGRFYEWQTGARADIAFIVDQGDNAFATDVRDAVSVWRRSRGLPLDPQEALRETGYIKRITKERAGRKTAGPSSCA